MDHNLASILPAIAQAPRWHAAASFLLRLPQLARLWWQRTQEREYLRAMDDRQLSDIGLSRADVERLAYRPFWRSLNEDPPRR